MLRKLSNPVCGCQVDYGDRAEHCWNGDHTQPNYISRLRYHQMYIPEMDRRGEDQGTQGRRSSFVEILSCGLNSKEITTFREIKLPYEISPLPAGGAAC